MTDILTTVSTRVVPQTEQAKPEQIQNSAGGFAYQAGDDLRLHRFLTLGTSGSTFYTDQKPEKNLTRENADVVFRALAADPVKVVETIVAISKAGRAPKQQPGLFALAIAASQPTSDAGRVAALAAIPEVCRTASSLFTFLKYCEQFRGWGKGLQKAVFRWYNTREVDKLAYQVLKYRQRQGFKHADALRLAHNHVTPPDADHALLYNWLSHAKRGRFDRFENEMPGTLPPLVGIFEALWDPGTTVSRAAELITAQNGSVAWEMLPDRFINEPDILQALIEAGMPNGALLRMLPRLSWTGLADGAFGTKIAALLVDPERLKRARVHPINVLIAMKTYAEGRSEKGDSTWTPARKLIDALDTAFYASFGAVEPTGKSTLLALDISGSMEWNNCSGLNITPREVSAALAMVTAAAEPDHEIVGFTQGPGAWLSNRSSHSKWGDRAGISKLTLSPRQRLDDAIGYLRGLPAGGTDCALPMLWAADQRIAIDTFVIYTDCETYGGVMHVDQALDHYRQVMGRPAKMVIAAMTAEGTSLCNPEDSDSMDISGFDSDCPQLISDFSSGRI